MYNQLIEFDERCCILVRPFVVSLTLFDLSVTFDHLRNLGRVVPFVHTRFSDHLNVFAQSRHAIQIKVRKFCIYIVAWKNQRLT